MHKKIHLFLIALCLFFLIFTLGCLRFQKKNSTTNQDIFSYDDPTNPHQFKVIIENSEDPFFYRARLTWKPISELKIYALLDGMDLNLTHLSSPAFINIPANKTSFLEIKGMNSEGQSHSLWNSEISTPQDFILHGLWTLEKDTIIESQRVFLFPNSKIQTNGFKLQINAQYFFSDFSLIESFSKNNQAPAFSTGKSGGRIEILSEKAKGTIRVILRGEKGGRGLPGIPWTTRQTDAPKARKASCTPRKGGCWCTTPAEDGKNGPKGNPGHPGFQGQRGGDSGVFYAKIIAPHPQFKIELLTEAGEGGEGGSGGPGQEGGRPSLPGMNEGDCKPATQKGISLGQGEPGPIGPIGEEGEKEESCWELGDDTICVK